MFQEEGFWSLGCLLVYLMLWLTSLSLHAHIYISKIQRTKMQSKRSLRKLVGFWRGLREMNARWLAILKGRMKLKKERKVAMNGMNRQGLCVKERRREELAILVQFWSLLKLYNYRLRTENLIQEGGSDGAYSRFERIS